MKVIGTAGHVDHGKSSLVRALTGINPDRLVEEQKREMTIDLGFAWMILPEGETAGIVDVPGHIDFIENMLAGVGGIDMVLFVIAADEGMMPQTREHLAILDLLEIKSGIIALTKVDLIDDPDWLEMVRDEIRKSVKGTVLAEAPVIPVSAKTGAGLDLLKVELARVLGKCPERVDYGRARLPIDRVFSMTGFGTVVTGTLLDGRLKVGEELEILPGGLRARIRGLQSHKQKVMEILPGSRAAVNLSNVNIQQVKRGDVLASPGKYGSTQRADISFRVLKDAAIPIKHNDSVKVFVGTQEVLGRVRLLGSDEIKPGEYGLMQLETKLPMIVQKGDRLIIRRPSPSETLGGGQILDIESRSRHRRFDPALIQHLEALLLGDPREIIFQTCSRVKTISRLDLKKLVKLDEAVFDKTLEGLTADHTLISFPQDNPSTITYILTTGEYQAIAHKIISSVSAFHKQNQSRKGQARTDLLAIIKLDETLLNSMLDHMISTGELKGNAALIWLPNHMVLVNEKMEHKIVSLEKLFQSSSFAPPSRMELEEKLGKSAVDTFVEMGLLIPLTEDILFLQKAYENLLSQTRNYILKNGSISVAQLRDLAGTSRKYAVAFLEYLDKMKITVRDGDTRKLFGV